MNNTDALKNYSLVTIALNDMFPNFCIELEYNSESSSFKNIECVLFDHKDESNTEALEAHTISFEDIALKLNDFTKTNDITFEMVKDFLTLDFALQNQMDKVYPSYSGDGWVVTEEGILLEVENVIIDWDEISKLIENESIIVSTFEELTKKDFLD